jgi:hypothetical protein
MELSTPILPKKIYRKIPESFSQVYLGIIQYIKLKKHLQLYQTKLHYGPTKSCLALETSSTYHLSVPIFVHNCNCKNTSEISLTYSEQQVSFDNWA